MIGCARGIVSTFQEKEAKKREETTIEIDWVPLLTENYAMRNQTWITFIIHRKLVNYLINVKAHQIQGTNSMTRQLSWQSNIDEYFVAILRDKCLHAFKYIYISIEIDQMEWIDLRIRMISIKNKICSWSRLITNVLHFAHDNFSSWCAHWNMQHSIHVNKFSDTKDYQSKLGLSLLCAIVSNFEFVVMAQCAILMVDSFATFSTPKILKFINY